MVRRATNRGRCSILSCSASYIAVDRSSAGDGVSRPAGSDLPGKARLGSALPVPGDLLRSRRGNQGRGSCSYEETPRLLEASRESERHLRVRGAARLGASGEKLVQVTI